MNSALKRAAPMNSALKRAAPMNSGPGEADGTAFWQNSS
jgi:hypothetical protein